jgi:hypothetical protein
VGYVKVQEGAHQRKDFQPLVKIRELDRESFGHTAEDGRINVVWSIRSTKDKNAV